VINNSFIRITLLAISFGFIGCSHTSELSRVSHSNELIHVDYSVIYYIHADSDYLYHDSDGKPVRGNSNVLATAFEVAEAARSGEIFIYYQRPERKLLGLLPRRSSRFYYFRNGQLISQVKYRHPKKKEAFLATAGQLMNQYRVRNLDDDHQNYFLYFGHEIPLDRGRGYHRSLPGIEVNTVSFVRGIQNFLLTDEDRLDLVVLSTCNNGTPAMAEVLMPFTDAMLASPQNLHLSHFDSGSMAQLEKEPGISSLQLGYLMAEQTYQRLEATVQTTITLALYDLNDIRTYIKTLTSLTASNKVSDQSVQFQDNVDCAELLFPDSSSYRNGVETWYKPARFGRQSGQFTHSGWGCKPVEK
jgi:hypothetical protein